jgi:hypothetical protein
MSDPEEIKEIMAIDIFGGDVMLPTDIRIGEMSAVDGETGKIEASGLTMKVIAHGMDLKDHTFFFVLDDADLDRITRDIIRLARKRIAGEET